MHSVSSCRLFVLTLGLLAMTQPAIAQSAAAASGAMAPAALEEVLNQSLAQKKGLAIHVAGQVINAIFVKRVDANMIEVRNQTFARILIRTDRIDAIAIP
jgi:hypothetical protein